MSKSIIIIGAGIGGLATGCYANMNGYESKIFELHDLPGGLCTSWKRKGYTFDGCIHWLVGSGEESGLNRLWKELGVAQGRQFVNHSEYTRLTHEDGKTLIIYTDPDQMKKHLKELSTDDADVIEEWYSAVCQLRRFNMPLDIKGMSLKDILSLFRTAIPFLMVFRKYRKVSIMEFASKFKDPFIRQWLPKTFGHKDFPVIFFFLTLAWMNAGNAGYPIGGSLELSRSMEKRYLNLGGSIRYKAPVEKIITKDNRAIGVRLQNGTEYFADYVVSAADGYNTIFKLLDGKYLNNKFRRLYNEQPIFSPIIQVSLGVNRDLSSLPRSQVYTLSAPIMIAGEERHLFGFRHFCFDPTVAPPGKSVIIVMFESNYDYWARLRTDKSNYLSEKELITDKVVDQLEKVLPGIREQIEIVDVTTPITYERYTGNWQGSMEGWRPTVMNKGLRISKTLPKLKNFYMVGQWVEPGGGVPPAAMSGRKVIKAICNLDRKKFMTKIK